MRGFLPAFVVEMTYAMHVLGGEPSHLGASLVQMSKPLQSQGSFVLSPGLTSQVGGGAAVVDIISGAAVDIFSGAAVDFSSGAAVDIFSGVVVVVVVRRRRHRRRRRRRRR